MSFTKARTKPHSCRALWLALVWACVLVPSKRILIGETTPVPIWSVDLKKFGFRAPRLGLVNDPGSSAQIAFSRNTVAVLFDERAEEVPEKGTDRKSWFGWRLRGVFLDAKTGDLLSTRSWIADLSWRKQIFPTVSGDFLLLMSSFPRPLHIPSSNKDLQELYSPHPTTLLLLSSTGDELRRMDLPVRGTPKDERWEAQISPSGESLLMTHTGKSLCEFVLLDTSTLKQTSSWKLPDTQKCTVASISDQELLIYGGKGRGLIGRFGATLRPISLPSGHSRFLSDDLIVTFGILPWGTAWITKSTGEQISRFNFSIHDPGPRGVRPGVGPPFVSAEGTRFGTIIGQTVGPHLFQREVHTVYVWQEPGNKVIFQMPLRYSGSQPDEGALSADGSRLLVVNTRKLSMYALATP